MKKELNTHKSKRIFKIILVLLIVTILFLIIRSTYSKYVTNDVKDADFNISNWHILINNLDINNEEQIKKFSETLKELEKDYKIVKNRKNRYRLIGEEFKEGIYRKNQKGFGFVKIEGQEDEIYISKENSLRALNGDKVLIEIIEEKNKIKSAEGKIKKIIKHEKDTLVGTFQKSENFGFVVPDDKSLGTDIFISKTNFGKARNGYKVLVEITKYPEKGKNAEGKIIEVLGEPNQAGIDMLSLIKEYKLPSTFPEQVVEEAKKYGNKIDKKQRN